MPDLGTLSSLPFSANVTLKPGGTMIRGSVRDTVAGTPIAGAAVNFNRSPMSTFQGGTTTVGISSAADGTYAIDSSYFNESGLTSGFSAYLQVTATNYLGATNSLNFSVYPQTDNIGLTSYVRLDPPAANLGGAPVSSTFAVTLQGSYASSGWTASSLTPWITVQSVQSTSTGGTVTYSVPRNTTSALRSGQIQIAIQGNSQQSSIELPLAQLESARELAPASTSNPQSTFVIQQAATQSRPSKLGAFGSGYWLGDVDGDFAWDGAAVDLLSYFSTGQSGEVPVFGDWNGDGRTKVGVYANGTWLLDYNGNGVWDGPGIDKLVYFGGPGYTPVVGDWNGSGTTKIGVYQNGTWLVDFNGNFAWDGPATDKLLYFGGPGYTPVVGDWNGSGTAKIGVHQNGTWLLDFNGNFAWDGASTDKLLYFGGAGYTPIVGDWNGSGTAKVGAYQNGYWILDYNGNFVWDGTSIDKFVFFGGSGYTPVVGDWNGSGTAKIAAYLNGTWLTDVNGNFVWDPPTDKIVFFGGPGQAPVPGKW